MALRARRARRLTFAAMTVSAATACSRYDEGVTADAGVDGAPGSAADASVTPGEDAHAPDGGAAGTKRLEEGFEEAASSCGAGWVAAGGIGPLPPAVADAAHGGKRSCRICQSATQTGRITVRSPSMPAAAGKRYVLEAFARRDDPSNPKVGKVFLEQAVDGDPGAGGVTAYNVSNDWIGFSVSRAVNETGAVRAVFTWDAVTAAACVFLDDVVIREEDP